jgi:hypothetical protein
MTYATGVQGKPRTVLLFDPELDDLNTLIRYLLYSDQFETEGLIYQSSMFHWKGDGQGTLHDGISEHVRLGFGPQPSWRWDADTRFMEEAVDVYEQVYPNLKVHSADYPEPDQLRLRIVEGNVEFPGDMSKDSPGSNLIRSLILDDKPGKLYLLSGAGQSTIGRALKTIEEEYRGTEQWEQLYVKICRKVVIQSFADQDGVYAGYIGPNWPDIEFRDMMTILWGYGAREMVLAKDAEYLSASWTREHISSVGPFGELYRVWGDGKTMNRGDLTDFFGHAGLTVEQLEQLGYSVWLKHFGMGLGEKGSWISEGDTTIYLNLLSNGLDAHLDASYGGWGGRNGPDIDPSGKPSRHYAVARWFGAAQRDFAARFRWSVTPRYEDANHAPVIELTSHDSKTVPVRPGQTIALKARVYDPDGDHVEGRWWRYADADTYPGDIEVKNGPGEQENQAEQAELVYPIELPEPGAPELKRLAVSDRAFTCQLKVPTDAADGQTIHLICEAQDLGTPSLTSYLRVVLKVTRI